MKKALFCNILAFMFIIAYSRIAHASAIIDKSQMDVGIISFQYNGDPSKTIYAYIEKDKSKYNELITTNEPVALPLVYGTGKYRVAVLEDMNGVVKAITAEYIEVKTIDEYAMYSASNIYVNYDASKKAVPAYKEMTGDAKDDAKINIVYNDVVTNYSYDTDKAEAVINGSITVYFPVIDEVYKQKKGICYDYSSLMAGMLRSQGVPVKLVKGYAPDIDDYHAWNEILIDGKWVVIDTTTDAAYAAAKRKYTFSKDAAKYKIVKVY